MVILIGKLWMSLLACKIIETNNVVMINLQSAQHIWLSPWKQETAEKPLDNWPYVGFTGWYMCLQLKYCYVIIYERWQSFVLMFLA